MLISAFTNALLKSQLVLVNINALWTNMNNEQLCLLTLTKINKLCNNYVKYNYLK